jgi:DNA-directed RNA polymerase subunit RPC12/RpoP
MALLARMEGEMVEFSEDGNLMCPVCKSKDFGGSEDNGDLEIELECNDCGHKEVWSRMISPRVKLQSD